MKKVIRYQCEFCKQEFKTPNRHNCKRDPAKKNCYTCQNNKGWEEDSYQDEYGSYYFLYPNCSKDGDIDAKKLSEMKYDMQCEHYKQLENGFSVPSKVDKKLEKELEYFFGQFEYIGEDKQ